MPRVRPLLQVEADAIDGADLPDLTAEHHAPWSACGLDQIADADHDPGSASDSTSGGRVDTRRSRRRCAPPRVGCGCTPRHDPRRRSAGPARRHGTRRWPAGAGANGHPGGRFTSDGVLPVSEPAARPGGVQPRHRSEKPAWCRASTVAVQLVHPGHLDRAAGVHHQGAVGELGDHPQVVRDDQDTGAGHVAGGPQHLEDLGVTSSAVVGSSQISRSGSLAIAMAITTAGASPPDSCAERRGPVGWAMPTQVEQLRWFVAGRSCRRRGDAPEWPRRSDRRRWYTGVNADIGSWKTVPMRIPRMRDISASPMPSSSCPSSRTEPETSAYPAAARSRAMAAADLPGSRLDHR